jgi:predicted nicotinamide N-methyase
MKSFSLPDAMAFIRAHTRPIAVTGLEPVQLFQADELTPIWQATEADLEARNVAPPFWAFAWAGGQGLARFLIDNPDVVRGKRVLDLAAGSGLVAIVAARQGAARVAANDIDPLCEAALRLNAGLNDADVVWRGGDLTGLADLDADVILAGDVFYEKPMAERFEACLRRARAAGADVYVGDPGRAYVPPGLTPCAVYDVAASLDLENSPVKHVKVWTL